MDAPLPATLCDEWAKFLADEDSREEGLDLYDAIFDHGMLFPLQRRLEMAAMMRMARLVDPRTVVEIGADKGGSFYHWIKCQPSVEQAFAIELRGVPYITHFQQAFPEVKIGGYAGSSYARECVAAVEKFIDGEPIDCLFIDGDKEAFDKDFDLYLPLMNQDRGIIFMHDVYGDATPAKVFRRYQRERETEMILELSEHKHSLERGGEPLNPHDGWLRFWARIPTCGVGVVYV